MRVHFTIKRNRDKEGNDTLSGFGKFSSFRGKRLANAWFKEREFQKVWPTNIGIFLNLNKIRGGDYFG